MRNRNILIVRNYENASKMKIEQSNNCVLENLCRKLRKKKHFNETNDFVLINQTTAGCL